MPFDGMVWRYLDNLYFNLLANKRVLTEWVNRLCARCCTQHLTHTHSVNAMLSHNWLAPHPPITRLQNVCHRCDANISFADGRFWTSNVPLAQFDPSCCWKKIAPPIPTCNLPFTFTHDSCVMSTICQSPRACRDDFQQLLPSRMD